MRSMDRKWDNSVPGLSSHQVVWENYGQEPVAIHLICTGRISVSVLCRCGGLSASRSTAEDPEKALCRQVLQILGFARGCSATARETTPESTTTRNHEITEYSGCSANWKKLMAAAFRLPLKTSWPTRSRKLISSEGFKGFQHISKITSNMQTS